MRKLQYARELAKQEKERDIASATGFARSEIRDFHDVFTAHANAEGEISVNGIRRMLKNVVYIRNDCELHHQLLQYADDADKDRSGTLDFPEFLILFRRLQDTNFGHINDHAEQIAASFRKHPVPPLSSPSFFVQDDEHTGDADPSDDKAVVAADVVRNRLRKSLPTVAWVNATLKTKEMAETTMV